MSDFDGCHALPMLCLYSEKTDYVGCRDLDLGFPNWDNIWGPSTGIVAILGSMLGSPCLWKLPFLI